MWYNGGFSSTPPPPTKIMGGCFGGKRPMRKPRCRWQDDVWRDVVELFKIRNGKVAERTSGKPRPRKGPKLSKIITIIIIIIITLITIIIRRRRRC
jgi:hypothetical protein